MDNNDNKDDFLGESIDEIFNSQFDKNNSKKKDDGNDETFIVDDDIIDAEKNEIDDEDDIYVLEDPGIEVVTINKPVENTEPENSSEEKSGNISSFDMEDEFELLEKEFDSVGNKKNTDVINDDPLDLEDEFVNMKPPEVVKEEEDLDEFVLESHQYSVDEDTPPPIPSISKDGEDFILDSEQEEEDPVVSNNSDYSSSMLDDGIPDTSALNNAEDIEDGQTDGRFFDSNGKPVNDAEILKSTSGIAKKKKSDNVDGPSKSLQRALDRVENDYTSPMGAMKKSNPLFEKKNLIIGGSVIAVIIIAVIFFIKPTFFGKSVPVQKNKIVVTPKKNNLIIKKKITPKKKKKVSDQEKINKLFTQAKKSFENGELVEAKKLCRQAISIKRTDALLFLEREIDEKIEANKKREELAILEKKDIDDYDKAIARDTVEAFNNYLKKHPDGKFFRSAKSMVNKLTKINYENRLKQIIEKARNFRKIRLREAKRKIGKTSIQKILKRRSVQNNFEIQIIDGDRVIIDYSTGLMWMAARFKMKFEKARLWAARHYAGYYNWRFPTAEEVFTLKGIPPSYLQKKSLNGIIIWTGDNDIDSSQNWIFSIREGIFSTSNAYSSQNLLTVRTIK